jgi:hypothetical protein
VKRLIGRRGLPALLISSIALVSLAAGTASASTVSGPVTKTFAFIGKPSSALTSKVIVSIDTLTINARCDAQGNPVIFAFTSATNADIFGRLFDGFGRGHIIKNSAFTKHSKGVSLAPAVSGDFNSSGTVMFENSSGKVVTINYAFDNATTLAKLNVCTVYGSIIAT